MRAFFQAFIPTTGSLLKLNFAHLHNAMICCHGNYCYVTNRNLCLCGKKQYSDLGKHKYLKLEIDKKNKEADVEFGIRKRLEHICNFKLLKSHYVHEEHIRCMKVFWL